MSHKAGGKQVLHVIGRLGHGGAELVVLGITRYLIQSGVDAAVVALGNRRDTPVGSTDVPMLYFDANPYSPWNVVRICNLARRSDNVVIHAHLFPAIYWVAIASLFVRKRNVLWVATEHSTGNNRRRYGWLRSIERFIYRRYTCVVCVSEAAKRSLLEWVPDLNHVTVIENGIDSDRFREAIPWNRTKLGAAVDDCVVLMVGAFREEKNQATLVKALARLPARFRLVLAGSGPTLDQVRRLARDLDVLARVSFLGPVDDVPGLMKAADVYVLPSLFEGFGISAVEACAAGLPIVYANVPGIQDILRGTGIPVDSTDPESIVRGILEAEGQNQGGAWVDGASAVARHYDIRRTEAAHRRLYERL